MCTYVNAVELPYSRIQYPRFHLSAINYEESTNLLITDKQHQIIVIFKSVIHNCNLSSTLQFTKLTNNDESYSI